MDGGTISDILDFYEAYQMSDTVMCYVTSQVLAGVDHMHNMHCVHRDIKSSNVLLSMQGEVKICIRNNKLINT